MLSGRPRLPLRLAAALRALVSASTRWLPRSGMRRALGNATSESLAAAVSVVRRNAEGTVRLASGRIAESRVSAAVLGCGTRRSSGANALGAACGSGASSAVWATTAGLDFAVRRTRILRPSQYCKLLGTDPSHTSDCMLSAMSPRAAGVASPRQACWGMVEMPARSGRPLRVSSARVDAMRVSEPWQWPVVG